MVLQDIRDSKTKRGPRARVLWKIMVLMAGLQGPLGCQAPAPSLVGDTTLSSRVEKSGPNAGVQVGAVESASSAQAAAPVLSGATDSAPSTPMVRVKAEKPATPEAPREEPTIASDTPSVPPTSEVPIDFVGAFNMAGVENPTIARAYEEVRASQADLLQARVLLVPTLNGGMNYHQHEGRLLASSGIIRNLNERSFYYGAGGAARAAESVSMPAVRIFVPLADAVFAPRAARQQVTSSQFNAQATHNQILLQVAERYLDLLTAEANLQALRQSEGEVGEVVRITANFAQTGAGRQGDADRAQSEALLLHREVQAGEEEVAVASAELARLLNRDPSERLRPMEESVPEMPLVDPNLSLDNLLRIARDNRPELVARQAEIRAAETRQRQEKVRPLLPMLSLGWSPGNFGGGSNLVTPQVGNFDGRIDIDAMAWWSLQNLGFGNLALWRERRAEVGQAVAERERTLNQINREVVEAHSEIQARRREVDVARQKLKRAEDGYHLDLARTKDLEGKPLEVLNSVNLLRTARLELIRALIGYNRAQFQLYVALGQPTETALCVGPANQ